MTKEKVVGMNSYVHLGSDEKGSTHSLDGCLGLIIFTPNHGAVMHYGNISILLSDPEFQQRFGRSMYVPFSSVLEELTNQYPQVKKSKMKQAIALYPETYSSRSVELMRSTLYDNLGKDLELKELPYRFSEDGMGHSLSLSMKTSEWESSLDRGSFKTYN